MRAILLLLFLSLPGLALSQGRLTGVVQDSLTHQPLPFASVFLANTTLGATTNEQGQFELAHVPPGTYKLVASYVGYRLAQRPFVAGAATQHIVLRLAPSARQLSEVVVRPRPNRASDFQKFKDLFIGRTSFSEQCRIVNPQDILVDYDTKTDKLTARTAKYLEIENAALGYRLKYYGLHFDSNFTQQTVTFYGQPVFEELAPRSRQQQQRWEINRQVAYRGSLPHFLKSVHDNTLAAEGFRVQKLRLVPSHPMADRDSLHRLLQRERRHSILLAAEEAPLPDWAPEPRGLAFLSLRPSATDSLRHLSADRQRVFLNFRDYLQVSYLKEGPDPKFWQVARPPGAPVPAVDRQVSRLALLEPGVEIATDGQLASPLAVFVDSYWGFEKIGEFLPLDYQPPALAPAPAK